MHEPAVEIPDTWWMVNTTPSIWHSVEHIAQKEQGRKHIKIRTSWTDSTSMAAVRRRSKYCVGKWIRGPCTAEVGRGRGAPVQEDVGRICAAHWGRGRRWQAGGAEIAQLLPLTAAVVVARWRRRSSGSGEKVRSEMGEDGRRKSAITAAAAAAAARTRLRKRGEHGHGALLLPVQLGGGGRGRKDVNCRATGQDDGLWKFRVV